VSTRDELATEAAQTFGVTEVSPITSGGQKSVFRGRRDRQPVVMKIVYLRAPYHENMLERARREVALLSSIDSPYVVRVLSDLALLPNSDHRSISDVEAAAWLEEELDGQDLSEMLGGNWPWETVSHMVRDLASGLKELHSRRVIHRDLSAGNVRRTSSGVWKVLDPGLAKHLSEVTITGVFQPGTPGFRTPEHVPGGIGPNTASDIFGLGILAYVALSGTLPIDPGADDADYNRRLHEEQCISIQEHRPDLTTSQAQLIDRMLQRQSARRFLDAAELLDAIESLD
jgi:serine/threonine protein kinase